MSKHLNAVLFVTLMLIILTLLYGAYLVLWPFKTLEVYQHPMPVLNSPLKRGEHVEMRVDYCKFTSVPFDISWQLVNDRVFFLEVKPTDLPTGCHNVVVSPVIIPKDAPLGEYIIRNKVTYYLNPIRRITLEFETEPFVVVE